MSTGINRILGKFLPIVFVIAGIIIIILGFVSLKQQNTFLPVKGVIADIQEFEERDSEGDLTYSYEVTVDYKIEGESYTSVMGDYKDGFEVGKEIEILYDPDDPSTIVSKGKGHVVYMFIVGIICAVIGIIGAIKGFARR